MRFYYVVESAQIWAKRVYTEAWWRVNAAFHRCQWEVSPWKVELFHVDLAAIFSFSPLSFFFFSSLFPLLEDVLECSTQALTVFPCGPSDAAAERLWVCSARGLLESVCSPRGNPPPLLSHLTSCSCRRRFKIPITFFFYTAVLSCHH